MSKMRKIALHAGVVGVILAAAAGAAVATGPDIGEQAEPLAHGHAYVLGLGEQQPGTDAVFSIRAQATSTGASGEMTWENGTTSLGDVKVTCLQVNGEDAIITGVSTIGADKGKHVVAEVVDNDTAGTTDQLRFSFQANGGIQPTSNPKCWTPVIPPQDIAAGFVETVPATS
jgi:hypothetical protein